MSDRPISHSHLTLRRFHLRVVFAATTFAVVTVGAAAAAVWLAERSAPRSNIRSFAELDVIREVREIEEVEEKTEATLEVVLVELADIRERLDRLDASASAAGTGVREQLFRGG